MENRNGKAAEQSLRRDRIRGSLIGGAAGDALGYAIEFDREKSIFKKTEARFPRAGRSLQPIWTGSALRTWLIQ